MKDQAAAQPVPAIGGQRAAELPAPGWRLLLHVPGRAAALLLASRRAQRVLYMFLAVDVAFIAFHLLVAAARYAGLLEVELPAALKFFSILNDYGLPEFWNQSKALLAATILSMTWARTRQTVYLCWVFVFAVVGLDDAFRVHEQVGETLNGAFFAGFTGDDDKFMGQLLVAGIYAIVFGGALLAAHAVAERRHALNSLVILFFFGILVFFAVVVDAAHGFVFVFRPQLRESAVFHGLFNVFEDGGELLSLSLALAVVMAVHGAVALSSASSTRCNGQVSPDA